MINGFYDMFYVNILYKAQEEAEKMVIKMLSKFYLPDRSGIVLKKEYEKKINNKGRKEMIR
jgi:hypothetical protein